MAVRRKSVLPGARGGNCPSCVHWQCSEKKPSARHWPRLLLWSESEECSLSTKLKDFQANVETLHRLKLTNHFKNNRLPHSSVLKTLLNILRLTVPSAPSQPWTHHRNVCRTFNSSLFCWQKQGSSEEILIRRDPTANSIMVARDFHSSLIFNIYVFKEPPVMTVGDPDHPGGVITPLYK